MKAWTPDQWPNRSAVTDVSVSALPLTIQFATQHISTLTICASDLFEVQQMRLAVYVTQAGTVRKSIPTRNISQRWAETCCLHEEVNADAVVTLKARRRGECFFFFFFRKADSILVYECCIQERGQ